MIVPQEYYADEHPHTTAIDVLATSVLCTTYMAPWCKSSYIGNKAINKMYVEDCTQTFCSKVMASFTYLHQMIVEWHQPIE